MWLVPNNKLANVQFLFQKLWCTHKWATNPFDWCPFRLTDDWKSPRTQHASQNNIKYSRYRFICRLLLTMAEQLGSVENQQWSWMKSRLSGYNKLLLGTMNVNRCVIQWNFGWNINLCRINNPSKWDFCLILALARALSLPWICCYRLCVHLFMCSICVCAYLCLCAVLLRFFPPIWQTAQVQGSRAHKSLDTFGIWLRSESFRVAAAEFRRSSPQISVAHFVC